MRVTDSQFTTMMTRAMMNSNVEINRVAEQIATGNKINSLSDDPSGSMKLLSLDKTISSAEQYSSNISNVQSKYSEYETYLMSVNDLVLDVHDLLLQANNATVGEESSGGIIAELESLRQQALDTFNKKSDGIYIFSGTDVYSEAIIVDDSTDPVSYSFGGNADHRNTKISEDGSMNSNFTVQETLQGSLDFFTTLDAAIAELKNPTENKNAILGAAIDSADATQKSILNTVTILGANYNSLDRMAVNNADAVLYAETVKTDINALDYAEASVRLTESMNTLQASQSVFAKVMTSSSLFDLM
ncbi:flagellar hook-associated protein FlgL [Vibrio diazotrophicus]|jgi:flagellar hook-associated protein 3 FlgL|uniref:flagellar hook-associated protein FlgL n=1 Tax=Vibrio diazotrophicus TaxID=685 RepID=UPI000C9DEE00|nr:flagellar hook-associated protein FlgL [Vibrio diazotrophicus]MCZ4372021.1 flagellar hook-associated protein FlgL [Vibrio diazotrophicus]PNH97981.1 flagellar hook-associated protein 3 [Vibrio diazotrophicus]